MYNFKFVFFLLLFVHSYTGKAEECPYGRPTIQHKNEVFIFLLQSNESLWEKLPWNIVTTIALFMPPDQNLTCLAHRNNVRVVSAGSLPVENLTNKALRSKWIEEKVQFVQEHNLDGYNIDFESEIDKDQDSIRKGLTDLVNETTTAFHKHINGSQVTVDVAWSPDGIDKRFYDYVGIAAASDYIFIMSYDEQSQIFKGPCTARANSPKDQTFQGMFRYMDIGIPTNKMILGLPWYGYKYPCVHLYPNNTCTIKKVPFRGASCSDAAGSEVGYNDILKIFAENATSNVTWDEVSQTPFFNFQMDDNAGQIWFDNPDSLRQKYQLAQKFNLKGVGMWTANFVDYTDTKKGRQQRQEMWQAIPYRH